jgi:uncharacterized membrane protein
MNNFMKKAKNFNDNVSPETSVDPTAEAAHIQYHNKITDKRAEELKATSAFESEVKDGKAKDVNFGMKNKGLQ